jgi:hypothetical protein
MINPIVRRNGGQLPRSPGRGEPIHWMHRDPSCQMAPFLPGKEQPARDMPDFEIEKTRDGFVFKADVPGIEEKDQEGNSDTYFAAACFPGCSSRRTWQR